MNRLVPFMLAAACTALSVPAAAQFAKPEDAVKYRQSVMFLQNQHFGRIAAMANGRVPYDAAAALANADLVATIAKLPWSGAYAQGTEGGRAKPEIWTEQAKFKELSDTLVDETGKLATAAKSNNLDAIKTSVAAVGETCKSCHDSFRKR
ncbi:Cytochrome c' [Variovorax sp. SRS16]|uniref:c-type cytochrome n=1 Tax=Variovorax sp. SRS16 TaxID=282217 RepID=UPI0013169639|nr:cytochrome c [Variovorax sp. SRS16]VTU13105.1 Cytochrome c' [Variovorax sp. SRS16]